MIRMRAAACFGGRQIARVKEPIEFRLNNDSYRSKQSNLHRDWVTGVTVPAFGVLAAEGFQTSDFCAVGTEEGLDILAAIEILGAKNIFIACFHEDIAPLIRSNIENNVFNREISVHVGAELASEWTIRRGTKFDLLYENDPGVFARPNRYGTVGPKPFANGSALVKIPEFVSRYLLTLHYLTLLDAKAALHTNGRVLCTIGGWVPLGYILRLASTTGYDGRILTYTWKTHSDPEDLLSDCAALEQSGLGPFRFYPVAMLETAFNGKAATTTHSVASTIERSLSHHAMSASEALRAFRDGGCIGHTVAVLESTNKINYRGTPCISA